MNYKAEMDGEVSSHKHKKVNPLNNCIEEETVTECETKGNDIQGVASTIYQQQTSEE